MRTCELCGLPTPPGDPPIDDGSEGAWRVEWHPRHVRRVHRYPLVQSGSWGCTRCGRGFDVASSWAADHQIGPGTYVRTFVICPGCAAAVRPTRLVVDVERIATEGDPPLRELVTLVRQRRRHRDRALRLRSEDTRRLADSRDVPIRELVMDLSERGLARVT